MKDELHKYAKKKGKGISVVEVDTLNHERKCDLRREDLQHKIWAQVGEMKFDVVVASPSLLNILACPMGQLQWSAALEVSRPSKRFRKSLKDARKAGG